MRSAGRPPGAGVDAELRTQSSLTPVRSAPEAGAVYVYAASQSMKFRQVGLRNARTDLACPTLFGNSRPAPAHRPDGYILGEPAFTVR